jgi:NAD(P)-dependent dehydrogenase (short-subunit alcohol dehydrogenase family)
MADRGIVLIVGTGSGISASLARLFHGRGHRLVLVSRDPARTAALAAETGALALAADAAVPADMERVFAAVDAQAAALEVAIYNAGLRARGPIADLDPELVRGALLAGAFGAFLMAQGAARRLRPQGRGTILFTGATASLKGNAQSAPFAMAKFALRGLAQAVARELQPEGIHVAHVVIDGVVRSAATGRIEKPGDPPDSYLDPDAIAAAYAALVDQPRSAWSTEVELRPWLERF